MATTITERIVALRERPSPATLLAVVRTIAQQGRLAETAYTALSSIINRPGTTCSCPDAGEEIRRGEVMAAQSMEDALSDWMARYPLAAHWLADVPLRVHSLAHVGDYVVAGEYRENDPRLFVMTPQGCTAYPFYQGQPRIRHIHCVHGLSADRFLVTTGDSIRTLDLWRIGAEGEPLFEKRLMRRLGGFTAAGTVDGRTYLGSDFSGRPNYLYRLDDGRRFFLPSETFRMFVDRIEVDGRFLICICRALPTTGQGRLAASIFDTRAESFVG